MFHRENAAETVNRLEPGGFFFRPQKNGFDLRIPTAGWFQEMFILILFLFILI